MNVRQIERAALAVVFITSFGAVQAGKLEKAFKALEVHDYFKARELFRKEIKKHPAAAWYGLSVISGRANNPFFNLDSAYQFILKADLSFTEAPDKERISIGAVGVSHTSIQVQRDHVYNLAWDVARGQNTVAAYRNYLDRYPAGTRAEEARTIMHHLAFMEARLDDTAEGYRAFMNAYPGAREVYEARTRMQAAIYAEATVKKDLGSYLDFIAAHPGSPHIRQAEDEVYRLSTPSRTIQEYRKFISMYPDNFRVPDAWRSIYENYSRDLSVGTITRFISEYPEYPFMDELVDDYKTASLELLPFRRDGKWGFIDPDGTERIKAEYEWVEPFKGGQALVSKDGRVGTINRTGRVVVPIEYDDVNEAVEGTSTVERANRVGAVDSRGDVVVPMVFTDLGDLSEGLAYAEDHGKYGYVNARGEAMIGFQFTSAGTFRNGLAVVERDGRFGVIDRQGLLVLPLEYDWVEGFEKGHSRLRKNSRMGLVDRFGSVILPTTHDHIGTFNDGLALVVTGNRCGYVDTTGRFVIPQDYETATDIATWGDLKNGLAEVQQAGKRCLVNARNEKVLACQYLDIGGTAGPLYPARKKVKWGFVDKGGTSVVEPKYDLAWDYVNGLARVKNGARFGAIDSAGKEVIAVQYTGLSDVRYDHVVAETENGVGLLDRKGSVVITPQFNAIVLENERIAKVERNDRFAYVRIADGRFIWKEDGFDKPGAGSTQ